jgi:LEA14-like dessication related protein
VVLSLRVDNPNVFTIHGRRMEVTLDLEDVRFGEMTHEDAFRLAGMDTTTVEVPVRVLWSAVGYAAQALLMEGELAYAIEGGVDLETPFGSGRVPYRQSGRLPLYRRTTSAAGSIDTGPTHP